jgi:hypothetical protein
MGRLELSHAPAQRHARSRANCESRRRFCCLGRRRLVENALERGQHLFWELSFGAAGREGLADRLPLDILPLERLPELRELFLRCFHVEWDLLWMFLLRSTAGGSCASAAKKHGAAHNGRKMALQAAFTGRQLASRGGVAVRSPARACGTLPTALRARCVEVHTTDFTPAAIGRGCGQSAPTVEQAGGVTRSVNEL